MLTLLLLVAAPCLAVSAFFVAQTVTVGGRQREASLRRVAGYGRGRPLDVSGPSRRRLTGSLARLALRLGPNTGVDAISLRLRTAGIARRVSTDDFLAARLAATVAAAGLGVLLALPHELLRGVVLAPALGAFGYLLPGLVVRMLARRRRALIAPALPDALDLLCVCVEAGLGLEAAIQKVTDELDGPLSDELELALGEIRIGVSRQDALEKLAERVDVPELTAVLRAVTLAERQGSPLARTLTVQATEARTRRQVAAEEQANKAPVKMLFPTVIFIFPALFLVVLGPAILTIADSL